MTNRNRIHIADWEIEREQSYAYWLMCAPIGDSAKSRLLLRLLGFFEFDNFFGISFRRLYIGCLCGIFLRLSYA